MRLVIARADGRDLEILGGGRRSWVDWRTLLISGVALMATPAASQAQNLIQNPGFLINGGDQSHSAPPWVAGLPGFLICANDCGDSAPAVTGGFYAAIADFAGNGSASQTVNIVHGGMYAFSFYYETGFAGAPSNALTATVGGQTVANLSLIPILIIRHPRLPIRGARRT